MEKTNETATTNKVPAFVEPQHTFWKDVMVTAYEAREIIDRNNPDAPPSVWHAVSVADGKGFQLKDISADKSCAPENLKTLEKYRVYFDIQQRPNKNGNLAISLKIVGYNKI